MKKRKMKRAGLAGVCESSEMRISLPSRSFCLVAPHRVGLTSLRKFKYVV